MQVAMCIGYPDLYLAYKESDLQAGQDRHNYGCTRKNSTTLKVKSRLWTEPLYSDAVCLVDVSGVTGERTL